MNRATSSAIIPSGSAGLRAKIVEIRRLVEGAKRDPNFRQRVVELLADLPEKDHTAEIEQLVGYTKRRMRYVRDPWSPTGLEVFIDPRLSLRDAELGRAAGDCDDHVLLASSLLETAGYPTRYVVGASAPEAYRHIWLEVQHPKRGWLPVELTKKGNWPTFRDPSARFPIVERHGGSMLNGLGAYRSRARIRPGGLGPAPSAAARGRRGRVYYRSPRSRGFGGRSRSLRGLGEIPPSAVNVHQDRTEYVGTTPSDFFRATAIRNMLSPRNPMHYSAMLDGFSGVLEEWDDGGEELGGVFSRVKGAIRRTTRTAIRPVKRSAKRATRFTKRGALKYGPEAAGIAAGILVGPVAGGAAYQVFGTARDAYLAQKAAEASVRMAPPPPRVVSPRSRASALPASRMSRRPGPSFVYVAEGFALPPGMSDQVAFAQQGRRQDAAWALPLPGASAGSYVPTPPADVFPNAPARDPFDTPAYDDGGEPYPGFGWGLSTAPWLSPPLPETSPEPYGTLFGLGGDDELAGESWFSAFAKNLGQQALTFGQGFVQQRTGIQLPVPQVLRTITPAPRQVARPMPVGRAAQRIAARPAPRPAPMPVRTMHVASSPAPTGGGDFGSNMLALGLGGAALLLLMGGRR